ncbi:MAG: prepilin-type N-terminal cleavage/methylation domain-containing protein, partial [Candidatus Saccharimonadales bacterium]
MKNNQKGFSVFEILIVLVVLGLIGSAGWYVWQSKNKTNTSNTSVQNVPNMPDFTSNIDAGTHSLTLKTSDKILMPSGAILSLPELDANSLPDFSYDNTYKSNSNKRLAINSLLEVYHNGYRYKITKGNCNTAEKTFDDYSQVVVTDCKVSVDVQKSNRQTLDTATVTKQYNVTEKNNPKSGPQQIL